MTAPKNLNPLSSVPAPVESVDQFYDGIEARIPAEVNALARLELQKLLREMRHNSERAKIVHWTQEEKLSFNSKLEELFRNPGEFTPRDITESVRALVTEKIANELSIERRHLDMLHVEKTYISRDDVYGRGVLKDTTVIGLELHLAFSPNDTVADALSRLENQYRGKYNAIILLDTQRSKTDWLEDDASNRPQEYPKWLIHVAELRKMPPETKLSEVPLLTVGPFPTLETPRNDVNDLMSKLGVNLMAVVDSKTGALNGILAHELITIGDARFYTNQLKTVIQLENFHHQIDESQAEASQE